jgi:hypothetical protein
MPTTEQQARALMVRHHHLIKNRQQSMLQRVGSEVGLPGEVSQYWNPTQGKLEPSFRADYDRSSASMS